MMAINAAVVSAKALPSHVLDITFANGEHKRFDIKPYLHYPVFQKLKDEAYFQRAHVDYGTVVWDEATDFSPDTLYRLGQPC
jgi:hypothetical protein